MGKETKNTPEPDQSNILGNDESFQRAARRGRIARRIDGSIVRIMAAFWVFSQEGREQLRDPEVRDFLFNREARTGLLVGTILNHELFSPNDNGTALQRRQGTAGDYVAYDFRRPEVFGDKIRKRGKQNKEGQLSVFRLEQIKDHRRDQLTPSLSLDMFDARHLAAWASLPLDQVIAQGYLDQTTYRRAYSAVGQWERYRRALTAMGLADKRVFSVTPKGNGVVLLRGSGGTEDPKKGFLPQLKPIVG
jgi:hypothetical protein